MAQLEQQDPIYRTSPERTYKMMAIMLGICIVGGAIFLANLIYSTAKGTPANMDDPFGLGGKYYWPYQQKNPHH